MILGGENDIWVAGENIAQGLVGKNAAISSSGAAGLILEPILISLKITDISLCSALPKLSLVKRGLNMARCHKRWPTITTDTSS